MNISIASDHAGFDQKQLLAAYLKELGHNVIDRGPDCDDRVDYPDFAKVVANDVVNGDAERGVLVCGTGIGMAIAANKVDFPEPFAPKTPLRRSVGQQGDLEGVPFHRVRRRAPCGSRREDHGARGVIAAINGFAH